MKKFIKNNIIANILFSIILSFGLINFYINPSSSHLIILFIYPPDQIPFSKIDITKSKETNFTKREHSLSDIAESLFHKTFLPSYYYSGIYSTYAGFVTISDHWGQIRFPRKHQKAKIKLLVTQEIIPIFMTNKIIDHFEIDISSPAVLYEMSEVKNLKKNTSNWKTKQIKIPNNRIISLDTIILFAKPGQIYIPEGEEPFIEGPQLKLPKIYATNKITINFNALYMLRIRQFFAPLREIDKIGPQEVSSQLNY